MIIDETSKSKDKLNNSLKFDLPFRAERKMNATSLTFKATSNPTTPTGASCPRHDYSDPGIFYVHRDFFASAPEHLSVFVDDELEVVEELAGGTWTRVKERGSKNTGLIPTEILESGAERLAKENKASNQDTIRFMSCGSDSGRQQLRRKSSSSRKSRKSVSFCEHVPEVINYAASPEEHLMFPFALDAETSQAIVLTDATAATEEGSLEPLAEHCSDSSASAPAPARSIFSRLFKSRRSSAKGEASVLDALKTFENYPDHLIRVYTGNFDSVLHAYKTFIVDESLTFAEFTQMVLATFQLDADGFGYEVNLINHLTAEIIPLDLDFSIEQVIELTKMEGFAFNSQMPSQLKKIQKAALKKLRKQLKNGQSPARQRDKSTDYVTPFKFVLNRIYGSADDAPIYVHLSLAHTASSEDSGEINLILASLFQLDIDERTTQKKKRWFKFGRKSKESSAEKTQQVVHRAPTSTQTPLHVLIHNLLESLQVPSNLPGIVFEASLPAIHDAVELPLPMNMPIGEVLKIRPKLDPAEQVVIIRPVVLRE